MGGIKPLPSIRIERGRDMPASKAQQKAVAKYMKANYDELKVRVDKGKKAELQAHAKERGETLNGFVKRAIDCQIERNKQAQEPDVLTGVHAGDGIEPEANQAKPTKELAKRWYELHEVDGYSLADIAMGESHSETFIGRAIKEYKESLDGE